MPGGKQQKYKQALPVPDGWDAGDWDRAYNSANSRIYNREGREESQRARSSGRTRELALASRQATIPGPANPLPLPVPPPSPPLPTPPEPAAMAALTPTYPLTKLQAEQVEAIYNEEGAKIKGEVETIQSTCIEKCKSNNKQCPEHTKEIRRLWRAHYTNVRPGSWASYRPSDYLTQMKKLFDSRGGINQIHSCAEAERRLHTRDALCTPRINDTPATQDYKKEAADMFAAGKLSIEKIRDFIEKKETEVAATRTPEQAEYDKRLAACETEAEKREVYEQDICVPRASDNEPMSKLRLKMKSLFDSEMPYPEIFSILNTEILDHQHRERILDEKLAELARAKAAHDKQELAKKEASAMKEQAARLRMFAKYCFPCKTRGCCNLAVPLSREQGVLECGLCSRLVDERVRKERSYFCTEECMEREGQNHVTWEHECAAGLSCTTGVFDRTIHEPFHGYCLDCWQYFGVFSYYCTEKCWNTNNGRHYWGPHVALRAKLARELDHDEEKFLAWRKKVNMGDEATRRIFAGLSLE